MGRADRGPPDRGRELAGLPFSDSKHGNDVPDSASIDPFRLFPVYHQPVNGEADGRPVSRLPP